MTHRFQNRLHLDLIQFIAGPRSCLHRNGANLLGVCPGRKVQLFQHPCDAKLRIICLGGIDAFFILFVLQDDLLVDRQIEKCSFHRIVHPSKSLRKKHRGCIFHILEGIV